MNEALLSISIALLVIFLVTWSILQSFKISAFCFVAVALILLFTMGLISALGVAFSTVVVTGLVLSTGLAIDFFVHVCEQFMKTASSLDDVKTRALGAAYRLRRPITSGFTTTFVAIFSLLFAEMSAFYELVTILVTVCSLAYVFALFIAPLFLPIIFNNGTVEILPTVDCLDGDAVDTVSFNKTESTEEIFEIQQDKVIGLVDEETVEENKGLEGYEVDHVDKFSEDTLVHSNDEE
ncbi:hypothetical protein RCL1_006259 [Eukaryota sp. TZLM3-RCL]